MIPFAALFFLVGAVLARGFSVWILIPLTLLAMIATMILELALGASLLASGGFSLLVGPAPQLGYAFGLLARNALVWLRSRRGPSVAPPYKRIPSIKSADPRQVRRSFGLARFVGPAAKPGPCNPRPVDSVGIALSCVR
jgi:hypothetical protein